MKKIEHIEPVNNNKSKGLTYTKLISRLNQSISDEYYLEAMVLEYAIFEDQFSEILKNLGLVHINEAGRLAAVKSYAEIIALVIDVKYYEDKDVTFNTISSKIKMIKYLSNRNKKCYEPLIVHKDCVCRADDFRGCKKNGLRSKDIRRVIDEISNWNYIRDQYVHSLYNKDYEAAMSRLPQFVDEGKKLSLELRNYSKRLKNQVKIHDSFLKCDL